MPNDLRHHLVRLAVARPDLRPHLAPILREAMEHATEDARKKYLQDHPGADPKNHTVKQKGGKPEGDKDRPEKKDKGDAAPAKGHAQHLEGIAPAHRKIVDDMPTKPMDKDEGYNHPKVKAAIKELKKLPLATVQKMYEKLQDKMDDLGHKLFEAEKGEAKDALSAAYGQVQQAWRAANQARAEMRWEKEDRDKGGVEYKYLPRAELKKRSKIPREVEDKLKTWEGSGKGDPVYRVLDELRVHTYVPHAKIDKAVEHLTSLAENPHHADDKEEILKLRDDLAKATGRLVKKGADLRESLIRLAHSDPAIRPHLLPILAGTREAGPLDASRRYQEHVRKAKALLQRIDGLIDQHDAEQRTNPANWGFTGDMANVVEQLEQLAEFLGSVKSASDKVARQGGDEFAIARYVGMGPAGHEQWAVVVDERGEKGGKWNIARGDSGDKSVPQVIRYYPDDQFARVVPLDKIREG